MIDVCEYNIPVLAKNIYTAFTKKNKNMKSKWKTNLTLFRSVETEEKHIYDKKKFVT